MCSEHLMISKSRVLGGFGGAVPKSVPTLIHLKLSQPSLKLSETPSSIQPDYKVPQRLREAGDSWRLGSSFRSLVTASSAFPRLPKA